MDLQTIINAIPEDYDCPIDWIEDRLNVLSTMIYDKDLEFSYDLDLYDDWFIWNVVVHSDKLWYWVTIESLIDSDRDNKEELADILLQRETEAQQILLKLNQLN